MEGDYEVGYGKPPAKNKFKKGQSGNLKGRPKKPLDLQKLFIAELKSSMTITESGKKKKVSKLEALTKSIIVHAMQGDKNYAKFVLDWIKALPKYAFGLCRLACSKQRCAQRFPHRVIPRGRLIIGKAILHFHSLLPV